MKLEPVLHRFFEDASALKLTGSEKAALRASLVARMVVHASDVHLTVDELARGKQALRTFMNAHPVDVSSSSWFAMLQLLPSWRMPAFALSTVIIVVSGGVAVASAAEGTLPGDALYTVKVDVLEPLRERMLRTPEERVAWKVRKVERRLAEARSLLQRDRFTESRRGLIEGSIAREVRSVQEAEQGMDAEMAIASQQVLEVTMENAVTADVDNDSEHPEWRHLKSFVRARRSDVHAAVRDRLQTAYGVGEDASAASSSVSAAAQIVESPESALMAVPASEDRREEGEDADEPEVPVMMLQTASVAGSTSSRSREKEEKAKDDSLRVRRVRQGSDKSQEAASRSRDADDEEEDGNTESRDVPNADTTVLQESVSSAALQYEDQDRGEKQEHKKMSEEAMERLKEKREHIEEQLRGFRDDGGLLR